MPYTQEQRLMSIKSPLGKDTLLLHSFSGHEGMSQLFHFSADFLSENHSISFKDIVGKQVTLQVQHHGDDQRHWNGFVSRFACVGGDNRFSYYRAEIVPWVWFLTRTADCQMVPHAHCRLPDLPAKNHSRNHQKSFSGPRFPGFSGSHPGQLPPA